MKLFFKGGCQSANTMRKRGKISSEKGVALITVVLMSALVVGLMALALTNTKVGNIVTTSYIQDTDTEECGHGNLEMAEAVFLFLAEQGQPGLLALQQETEIDASSTDVMVELNEGLATSSGGGGGTTAMLAGDTATSTPDFTILSDYTSKTATTTMRDCQTNVDFDYLYSKQPNGSSQQVAGYDDPMVGPLCDDGAVYAIDTVANDTKTNTATPFRSAYYKCPD